MRIGILTGGGDVPGLNPCIKAIVTRAEGLGWDTMGFRGTCSSGYVIRSEGAAEQIMPVSYARVLSRSIEHGLINSMMKRCLPLLDSLSPAGTDPAPCNLPSNPSGLA